MNILIVDDEARHRRGMTVMLGVMRPEARVQAARNGEEALEAVRSWKPDIVISDIRMPGMDGLDFLKRMAEEGHRAKVVMLSAYNLFEYAQTALRHGAFDYLLKPVEPEKVEAVLSRIEALLAAEARQELRAEALSQRLRLTASAYHNRLLVSWLAGTLAAEERAEVEALNLIAGTGIVACAELRLRPGQDAAQAARQLPHQLEAGWSRFGDAVAVPLPSLTEDTLQAAVLCKPRQPLETAAAALRADLAELGRVWEDRGRLTHGVGTMCADLLAEAPASFRAAQAAGALTFYDAWRGVVFHAELRPQPDGAGPEAPFRLDGERLFAALRERGPEAAVLLCREAFDACAAGGRTDPAFMKQCAALTVMKLKSRARGAVDRRTGQELADASASAIPSCASYGELLAILERLLRGMHRSLHGSGQDAGDRIVEQCLAWIRERCAEDLTLDTAAERFAFNASYFSTLIKGRTGRTFTDHLTEARMARARGLLAAGRLKIYEIAEQCGYRDTKYFCRMFKKRHGLSPEAYKHTAVSADRNGASE